MGARRVFVDASLVGALAASEPARRRFDSLLAAYERGDVELVTHRGEVAAAVALGGADAMAVCEVVELRRWLRRLARRVLRAHPDLGFDRAATLVVLDRYRIGGLASADPVLSSLATRTVRRA